MNLVVVDVDTGELLDRVAAAEWPNVIKMPDLIAEAPQTAAIWQQWMDLVRAVPVVRLGRGRTFAELSGPEKNEVSHRGRALADLPAVLAAR